MTKWSLGNDMSLTSADLIIGLCGGIGISNPALRLYVSKSAPAINVSPIFKSNILLKLGAEPAIILNITWFTLLCHFGNEFKALDVRFKLILSWFNKSIGGMNRQASF